MFEQLKKKTVCLFYIIMKKIDEQPIETVEFDNNAY